jgi:hypothetical protein
MLAGATADKVEPVAPLQGEPAPIKAEAWVPHPADLLALQVPSQWILEAAAATSRDQASGTAGSVARCELQLSGNEKSGDEPPLRGLWKGTDDKGGTLHPVEPTNRRQNTRRQALHILTSSKRDYKSGGCGDNATS